MSCRAAATGDSSVASIFIAASPSAAPPAVLSVSPPLLPLPVPPPLLLLRAFCDDALAVTAGMVVAAVAPGVAARLPPPPLLLLFAVNLLETAVGSGVPCGPPAAADFFERRGLERTAVAGAASFDRVSVTLAERWPRSWPTAALAAAATRTARPLVDIFVLVIFPLV